MIDFHTHILPGLDDGSKDINMTHEMLEMEAKMGTDLVIATPHFYAHRNRIDEFLKKREKSFDQAKDLLAGHPEIPKLKVGAEVYYFSGIGRAQQVKELTVEGTDVLLLELPFRPWERSIIDDIRDLKDRQHLRVILAHAERYKDMQKDRALYEDILDEADIIQINAGCFDGGLFKRNFALKLLKSGRKAVIGSDCHNTTTRKPNVNMGYDIIERKIGSDKVDELKSNLEGLFR